VPLPPSWRLDPAPTPSPGDDASVGIQVGCRLLTQQADSAGKKGMLQKRMQTPTACSRPDSPGSGGVRRADLPVCIGEITGSRLVSAFAAYRHRARSG
jgi:hypothetical protein